MISVGLICINQNRNVLSVGRMFVINAYDLSVGEVKQTVLGARLILGLYKTPILNFWSRGEFVSLVWMH